MHFNPIKWLLLVGITLGSFNTYSSIIRVPAPRSVFDISHDYHVKLANMALERAGQSTYEIRTVNSDVLSQRRAESELQKGDTIDLYWFGASKDLDQRLIAIPIPTTRGIIGFRKFIIRKENTAKFNSVTSLNALRKLVACQGEHWPDTKILNEAGLPVTTAVQYENLFMMVNHKRCDYFPRGYHDAINELVMRKRAYPDLVSFPNILLHYPFAIYFYTNHKQTELAEALKLGLTSLAKSGDIEKLMKRHDLTKAIFPLANEHHTTDFAITNSYFSENPRLTDPAFWIQLSDFKAQSASK